MKNTRQNQTSAKLANKNIFPEPAMEGVTGGKPSQTLVVVLGMHRSGTSVITRALKVLGIELGDTLMPAVEDANPKGFWEDIHLNALNIEMLEALGSDWHHLSAIEQADVELLRNKGYFLRAIELLRKKVSGVPVFGFKDPRVAKLFPFWKEVFAHCQFDVDYVLAVRHPLSVVKSLAKRDGFDAEKSYLLWLNHVLTSLSGSIGSKCILVDYDLLIQAPDHELNRIAKQFDLKINPEELQSYKMEFLDQNLRHTIYQLEDLLLDNACPPMVREVYTVLLDIAADKIQINDSEFLKKIELWQIELKRISAPLALADKLFTQKNTALQTISELSNQIIYLNQAIDDCNGQINNLNQSLVAYNAQITELNQVLTKRDEKIAELNQDLADRDSHIAILNKTVKKYDHEISELRNSNSWRITKPLRFLSLLLSGKLKIVNFVTSGKFKQFFSVGAQSNQKSSQSLFEALNGFDKDLYLKLNPDLAKIGVDPTIHYLRHGRREGRLCSLPDIPVVHNFNDDLDTILIVSHDATRTGAPVLSLNIVQALVGSYNVFVLLLGGGPLTDAFQQAGAVAVLTSPNLRGKPTLTDLIVGQLCARFNFKFALVNSIESRLVLPYLANNFVPTISLIHEFASNTRPRDAFREAFLWSGEVVFSANVTKENALTIYPDLIERDDHILPQGRCLVPLEGLSEEQLQEESTRIRFLIRPKTIAENSLVILGAGYVQVRKGLDLFIECAARVVHTPEGRNCRFVWIGKGFDPDNDTSYSVYLEDQIQRSGLEGHVIFANETTALDTAYEEADLFLLSSRLDPLPNVAIDAMVHGVPVLCFNKTTGIADFLIDADLGKYCVAEYLDSVDMAEKILALAVSQDLRAQIGDRCREASIKYFDMKKYVSRLEVLAEQACERTKQEKEDMQVILSSGLFNLDFSCPTNGKGQPIETAVRSYVRSWASEICRRKPFPGFHPGIYQENHGLALPEADPFADYLRAGQPDGPWNYPVIVSRTIRAEELPRNQRVALHLHVYYPELLLEITTRLSHNRICPDLFVSIANEEAHNLVVSALKNYKGNVVDIQLVPNRGRDIGPFLTAFGQRISTNYDFIGHIHTKKTVDIKDANIGKSWYRFLLENLIGGESGAMLDNILVKMTGDNSIGMVFPDDPNIIGWTANRPFAESVAESIGIEKLPEYFNFPIGTMFWARTSALAPLMNLKLDWDDYPEEPLPYDGSLLHAIERLFSVSLSVCNLRYATTNVTGLTR